VASSYKEVVIAPWIALDKDSSMSAIDYYIPKKTGFK
jgi:hypothetical protein